MPENIAEARIRDFASGPLVGTPELIAERLTQLSELGMSYAILNFAEVAYPPYLWCGDQRVAHQDRAIKTTKSIG